MMPSPHLATHSFAKCAAHHDQKRRLGDTPGKGMDVTDVLGLTEKSRGYAVQRLNADERTLYRIHSARRSVPLGLIKGKGGKQLTIISESARQSGSISFADTLSGLTIERSGPRGWTWNWPVIGRPTQTRRLRPA